MTATLHVGINAAFLTPGAQGGLETYARELVPRLAQRPDLRVTVFASHEAAELDWGAPVRRVRVHPADRKQWVIGDQVFLPMMAPMARVDLVHSLASTSPLWGPFRRVTTIHDLNYKMVPDAHAGILNKGMAVLVAAAGHRAHRVIAISETTRTDVVKHLKIAESKVDVVYNGVTQCPRVARAAEADLRARYDLADREVVLCVAAKRPSKNLARLIEAHATIDPRPILVLPGYPTAHEAHLRDLAWRLGTEKDIRFLGWVSAAELEGFYSLATLLAFPSLYEGFGLPPLEAMARGLPVVTSKRGSLGEVVGAAAVVVDPESVTSIGEGIRRVLLDPRERTRLRLAGRERAARFTWDAAAEGTVASYRRATL